MAPLVIIQCEAKEGVERVGKGVDEGAGEKRDGGMEGRWRSK